MNDDPPVSTVILTTDDVRDAADCLDALRPQLGPHDEIVVLRARPGAAGPDAAAGTLPEDPHVRVHDLTAGASLGESRAAALRLARHDVVAILVAEAVPAPDWLARMRAASARAEITYGRQEHAPRRQDAATVSRGLRYHHFDPRHDALPETYASLANACYRKRAVAPLCATDDPARDEEEAFARLARYEGLRITYEPRAVVRHHDAASFTGELRRHVSHGRVRALLRDVVGSPTPIIAWALAVGILGVATAATASGVLLGLTLLTFFAPTLRRLASPVRRRYHGVALAAGAIASPFFDLAFVGSYLHGRMRRS